MNLTTTLLLLMATIFTASCGGENSTERRGADSGSTGGSARATDSSIRARPASAGATASTAGSGIIVTSTAFTEGGMIPTKYTCDGEDISPPIDWSNIPPQAKSIALICDDPDAPKGPWVHWVAYNILPEKPGLPEHARMGTANDDGKQGFNSFKNNSYGGPCPPSGSHRYFFRVYALDTMLDLRWDITREDLEKAMKGHVLAEGSLMGRYQRP
jgi:Raf kinase inhibitor-like YbhB/YbcL family protein